MHTTLTDNVLGRIDVNQNGHIQGWAFHVLYGALPLRCWIRQDVAPVLLERTRRNDVIRFYKELTFPTTNQGDCVGFDFSLNPVPDTTTQLLIQMGNIDRVDEWNTVFSVAVSQAGAEAKVGSVFCPEIRTANVPSFVVMDDFYKDPDAVREFALNQDFSLHPAYHKGKRTDNTFLFPGIKEAFEEKLGVKIAKWSRYGTNGCFQYCVAGDQLVYHYDGQEYAGVLFLTPDAPPQSGTRFYRSKHTKKMTVDPSEEGVVFKNGYLDPTEFELVDVVGNVYNRVVLFNAKMIHSASDYFGTHLQNGRLFQLFFFDLEK